MFSFSTYKYARSYTLSTLCMLLASLQMATALPLSSISSSPSFNSSFNSSFSPSFSPSSNLSSGLSSGLSSEIQTAQRPGSHAIDSLFGDEIQQAASRLKWRGEPLASDTLYALALTGLSWETGWGREHLFSLAWGELRKIPGYRPRNKSYPGIVSEIRSAFERHDYRKVVKLASDSFSLDEIACDPNLKEPVAQSFLELRQPERAFPIFSAPFEPLRARPDNLAGATRTTEVNRRCRQGAYEAAQRAGLHKEAIVFGLSLLLDPGTDPQTLDIRLLHALEAEGVDIDRLASGILQAPESLRGFADYAYPVADLYVIHATPRQLPLLLHLVGVDDVYLRSRALIGLGIVAFRTRKDDTPKQDWFARAFPLTPLREYGISNVQRKQILQEVQRAIRSDHYQLRAAACLVLALMGDEADVPQLQKLAQDRAYLLSTDTDRDSKRPPIHGRSIRFPVRQAATLALSRFLPESISPESISPVRELTGKELDQARRGGQDVTNDHRNLRRVKENGKDEIAQGLIDFGW